jgi:membrane protein DedA with SNARE-associated domain
MSNLPAIVISIEPFVKHYGYFGMAALLLLESTGIPLPGETTLITAAVFAGIGQLNIVVIIIVGIIASIIGDNIGYLVGYLGGRKLISKYGKYILITDEKYTKIEKFFNRRGGLVVTFARFFEGFRQLNGFVAGSSDMKWKKFLVFNSLGAILWVTFWSLIGYYGGNHIATLFKYQSYLSFIVIFIVFALFIRFLTKRRNLNGRT